MLSCYKRTQRTSNEIPSWEEKDVRGNRNLAEQISNAVLEALSGLNMSVAVNNNMDSELISSHVVKTRIKRLTTFK
jgi:hypothetical protein